LPTRVRTASIALALSVGAFALLPRVAGHRSGVPYHPEPDPYLLEQVRGFEARGLGSRFDAGWKYPLLVAFLTSLLPLGEETAAAMPGNGRAATREEREESALDPTPRLVADAGAVHGRTRLAVALLSALIGPATFLLARAFLSARWSAVAGVLASGSLLHVVFSGQARPHGPASAFAVLAVAAAVHAARRPHTASVLSLGAATTLACTALHTGALTLAPTVLAIGRAIACRGRRIVPACVGALALVAAGVYWAYAPGERATKLARIRTQDPGAVFVSGHELPPSSFDFSGTRAVADWLVSYDPLLIGLAVLGLGVALRSVRGVATQDSRQQRFSALVVASYVLPALLLYCAYARTAPRLLLALTAVLAVPAAVFLARGTRRLSAPLRTIVTASVLCLATGPGLWLAWLRTRPTVHVAASEWLLEQRLPTGARPTAFGLNLPSLPVLRNDLEHVAEVQWLTTEWERFQVALAQRDGGEAARRFGVPFETPAPAEFRDLVSSEDMDAAVRTLLEARAPDLVLLDVAVPLGDPPPDPARDDGDASGRGASAVRARTGVRRHARIGARVPDRLPERFAPRPEGARHRRPHRSVA
jgi:hypothetical protein